jgi:hypothetical protein
MDHKDAVATQAIERYLLDEMSADERDLFEAHFFDCSECAFDVRSGVQMIAALPEDGEAKKGGDVVGIDSHRKWSWWVPQAAAASVIFATMGWYGGMQHAVSRVAVTSQPRITEIAQVDLSEAERGPGDVKVIPAGAYASLNVEIPHADEAASYAYAVVDAAGKTWFSGTKSREQAAAEAVSLLLPALPRGSYRVVIEGVRENGNRFPIDSKNFRVGER